MNLYAYLISSFSHRNVQHESSNTLFYLILYQFNAVVPAMNPITLCVLLSNPMNKYPPSVLAKDESIEGSCCRIRVLSCLAETDVFLILTELPNLTDSPA
uniref:Uncharacterized protein n=1 Tax=Variola virus TaxID=10255 RepID=B5KIN7_VARV|nr:hypothetical protein Rw-18_R9 [Variola virus]